MPAALSYPGVYIEEIPSGVRTITGVATSITAFIGRARRGRTNEPVIVNSFGDFERSFGGLQEDYPMSYAIRDFFLNGGSQGIVVRLAHPNFASDTARDTTLAAAATAAKAVADAASGADVPTAQQAANAANQKIQSDKTKTNAEKQAAQAASDAVDKAAKVQGAKPADLQTAAKGVASGNITGMATKAVLRLGGDKAAPLVLEAADEGGWGNSLRARVDHDDVDKVGDRFSPLSSNDLFNLTVRDASTGVTERFLCVTTNQTTPRRVDRVLANGSNLVRAQGDLPGTRPPATDDGIDAQIDGDKTITADQKADAKKQARQTQPFSSADKYRSVGVLDADQASDGGPLDGNDYTGEGLQDNKRGLYTLDKADLFNLLCIPADTRGGDTPSDVYSEAMQYCVKRRAVLLVDSPASWSANPETAATNAKNRLTDLNLNGEAARNAAVFFPRVIQADPTRDGQLDTFVPCGIIAGIMARTDTNRGVWKAPAGLDAAVNGIRALEVNLNDAENGMLNPLGINCLRFFPIGGRVVWGSRTLRGADQLADEYKYIPVRRTALFIEESLYRGLQWVVFEPNDEPLWAQIRLNVGAFMHNLFRQGAFQGTSPRDAYFVKCDKETTTQNDIDLGIVNVVVGFAPLKPAEFVVIKLQQMAGQIDV